MRGHVNVALVGPLPPPFGGMATQTRQLARLLQAEGLHVEVVPVNPPYRPHWIASFRGVRALFRLIPYLFKLWSTAGRADLFHVMANSGWAWHLCTAPAVWIGRMRRVPVIINYRGGAAEQFFKRSLSRVAPTMRMANRVIVPSQFLQEVFARFGFPAEVIPNVIDLDRFASKPLKHRHSCPNPHLIVTRNLEAIYDIPTALRAFAIIVRSKPGARMTIAGTGPEEASLVELCRELGVRGSVKFAGRLDNDGIEDLYEHADVFVNSSLVDNMPNSILEALASGVPVVSSDVGGIPFMVEHDRTAVLVHPRDPHAMARAVLDLIDDPVRSERLARAGRAAVQTYGWFNVRSRLFAVYRAFVPSVPASGMPTD